MWMRNEESLRTKALLLCDSPHRPLITKLHKAPAGLNQRLAAAEKEE